MIRACLDLADLVERIEANAIAREAHSQNGPRTWLLGPPPPAPRLARHTSLPVPVRVSAEPADQIDLDDLPTSRYHEPPRRDD